METSPELEPDEGAARPGLFDEVAAAPGYRPRLVADSSTRRRARRDQDHPARTVPRGQTAGRQLGRGGGVGGSGGGALRLADRLTVRDRWLLRMLLEHRVLTTGQIAELAFGSRRMANVRLRTLHQLGVVERFRPFTDRGSAPLHYVLSPAGADVLAAAYDTPVADLGYRPERLAHLAVALHLAHDVGANGIFTALAADARRHDQAATPMALAPALTTALTAWWSERRCLTAWDGLIRPDGYGRWLTTRDVQGTLRTTEVDFFLEYDAGTENLNRVVGKLDGYARLAAVSGLSSLILFWLPSLVREAHLHGVIADWHADRHGQAALPIATAVPLARLSHATAGPADPVWLPVTPARHHAAAGPRRTTSAGRRTLAELAELLRADSSEREADGLPDGMPGEPLDDVNDDVVTEAPDPRAPSFTPQGTPPASTATSTATRAEGDGAGEGR